VFPAWSRVEWRKGQDAAMETVMAFRRRAGEWLDRHATRRARGERAEPSGSDSVALLPNVTLVQDRAHLEALRNWIREKADAGFDLLSWDTEWGGQALPAEYEHAFAEEESSYVVPLRHAAIAVTRNLVAPTIRAVGTPDQQSRFLRPMLSLDEIWCQLFSEPGAGSDLAAIATRAERDGDGWVINGQKVWTSGAHFAAWGYVQCRTDPTVPKHVGLTAFVVPMTAPGVEVRPLRQMSGGASFNEVFFKDVRLGPEAVLGGEGNGWKVALTTLGFERGATGEDPGFSTPARLAEVARRLGRYDDPVVRQHVARVAAEDELRRLTAGRVKAGRRDGATPGPEGSIGKLLWTRGHQVANGAASTILGTKLVTDTGEWGTYAWAEHVLGAPGYRIAGGTDEIQHNIIGERVLGLPAEPRLDRGLAFRDIPR
jgi:alkylation response protein AidB-like acyl-CoA dehydrogenase